MVEINENGVYFFLRKKSLHMSWNSIKMIAVSKYGVVKSNKRIIFSSKYDRDIFRLIYPYSALSNKLLFLQNRKGLIKEIEKYWDKEIINKSKNSY